MSELSILIVSYNTRDVLARCLASLAEAPPALTHECIVIDNASTDGTREMLAAWPAVTCVEAERNLGFARANNRGLALATGSLVLYLNSDTIVPPGAIDSLVGELTARPRAAAVGPRLTDADGHAELSFGSMVGPAQELFRKSLRHAARSGHGRAQRWIERRTRRTQAVDWLTAACLLARRQDLDAVGGFDERYFMYWEDVDLGAALRARGRELWFVSTVQVVHLGGRSASGAARATEAAYRRAQVAFYEKHHPRWAPVLRGFLRVQGKWPPSDADT